MPLCFIRSLWYHSFDGTTVRRKDMKLAEQEKPKVIVQIRTAQRDTRETIVNEETKKPEKNKMYGKIVYETIESFDVFESNAKEVSGVVLQALQRASTK